MKSRMRMEKEEKPSFVPRTGQNVNSEQGQWTHLFLAEYMNSGAKKIAEEIIVVRSNSKIVWDSYETALEKAESRAKELLNAPGSGCERIFVSVRHLE